MWYIERVIERVIGVTRSRRVSAHGGHWGVHWLPQKYFLVLDLEVAKGHVRITRV